MGNPSSQNVRIITEYVSNITILHWKSYIGSTRANSNPSLATTQKALKTLLASGVHDHKVSGKTSQLLSEYNEPKKSK
jgi:hypothetical protein